MNKLFYNNLVKDMDDLEEDEEINYSYQMTPQNIIDRLSRYTVRKNGAYSTPDYFCGLCFNIYSVGDRVTCLPCHHNFHEYCIENWLKWVKPSCPIDKKEVITRHQYCMELVEERGNRSLALESTSPTEAQNLVSKRNSTISISSSDDDDVANLHDKNLCVSMPGNKCKEGKTSRKRNSVASTYTGFNRSLQRKGLDVRLDVKDTRRCTIGNKNGKRNPGMTSANAINCITIENYEPQGNYKKSRKNEYLLSTVSQLQNRIANETRVKTDQCKNPSQLDKELEILVSQLKRLDTSGKKTKPFKTNIGFTNLKLNPLPCKKKLTNASLRRIMGGKNITFGEILEIEREDNCGWMYKSDWYSPYCH